MRASRVLISGCDNVAGTQASAWENLGFNPGFVPQQHCERGQVLPAAPFSPSFIAWAHSPTSWSWGDEGVPRIATTGELGSKQGASFFSFWALIGTRVFIHIIGASEGVYPDTNPSPRFIWTKKTAWEISIAEASRGEAREPALKFPVEPATWNSSTQLLFNSNSTSDQEINMQKERGQKPSLGSRSRRNSEELEARVTKPQWFSAVCCGTPRHSSVENKV